MDGKPTYGWKKGVSLYFLYKSKEAILWSGEERRSVSQSLGGSSRREAGGPHRWQGGGGSGGGSVIAVMLWWRGRCTLRMSG